MDISKHPNECIFHLLTRAARRGGRAFKAAIDDLGLTAVQGRVLNLLWVMGDARATELGEQVELDSATITGVLDRLAVLGLIERRQDENDRRVARVFLTPAGNELGKKINERVVPANEAFLDGMTENEVAALKKFLKQL